MAKYKKYLLPPALIAGALIVVIVIATNRPQPPEREPTVTAMLVDVIPARQSQGHFTVTAEGIVRPRTQTDVAAEVSGRLVSVADRFTAGGFFEAGQMLAQIDPSDYEAALLQARAELASAEARLADEQARSDQARLDWQRMHGDEREPNDLVLRLPQLAGAKAAVDAARSGVLRAERNLERTRITLPYDGLVRSRNVDVGQYVTPGMRLGVTFAVDVAEVRLPLSNQERAFLNLPRAGEVGAAGPAVKLLADIDGQTEQWDGRVVRTEGVIDENTRLSYAVVAIQNPYQRAEVEADGPGESNIPLPMGTFVEARIEGRSSAGLIQLPRSALREGDSVYVANADDELEVRSVDVVRATTEVVYVENNIEPGDRVITTGITAPIPGSQLRVRSSPDEPELRLTPAPETTPAQGVR